MNNNFKREETMENRQTLLSEMYHEYLDTHNINAILEPILKKLLVQMPAEPIAFIVRNICTEYPDQAKIAIAAVEKNYTSTTFSKKLTIEKPIVNIDAETVHKSHSPTTVIVQPTTTQSSSSNDSTLASPTNKIAVPNSPSLQPKKAIPAPFPKLGLKLSYLLNEFLALCGGRTALEGKTTTDVNLQFQKKLTESAKLSFCDYLNQQQPNHPAVGKASVFISHAWKYLYLDVMDALQNYFLSDPDILIWFDICSVNQHAEAEVDLDFDWWSNSFKSAIRDFGRTVMVLAPWQDPVPLRRGWCLFEIYSTIVTESKFEVAMTESSREAFLKDVISDAKGSIYKMLATIDVMKSECFMPEDRERIFEIVRREVGVSEINSMIFERMRTWVIETTDKAIAEDPQNLDLVHSLATLHENQGQYGKAEPLFVACLEQRRAALGERHPATLTSMDALANLYSRQGQYGKAEPLHLACLEQRRVVLGESHLSTLASMNNLGLLYYSQGQYGKAEPLYVTSLQQRRIALGEGHLDTLTSMSNLAGLYKNQRQFEKAEPLYVASLEQRRIALGESHPDTLTSMNGLAVNYTNLGQYEQAELLHATCLAQRRVALGERHPHTLTSMNNLAALYKSQGQFEKAEQLYVACLEHRRAALPEKHPHTLQSMSNLGDVYYCRGQYELAQSMLVDCLKIQEDVLVVDHPDTMNTRKLLDKCLRRILEKQE